MLLGLLSAGMISTSLVGIALNTELNHLKRTVVRVLRAKKIDGVAMRNARRTAYGCAVDVTMPYGLTFEDFRTKCVDEIAQATHSHVKLTQPKGAHSTLLFGRMPIDGVIPYRADVRSEALCIPLATPFGWKSLNLKDDNSCHMQGGGATRMGKTSLINLIIIHALRSTEGGVQIVAASSKISDFHIYKNVPQITLAETPEELTEALSVILEEMDTRKKLLKQKGDVKDIHSFRRKYPDETILPVLVVIDEYGAFSDKHDKTCEQIRQQTIEIAERSGYLDIHLLTFSQRSDATDIYPPRVKNNMLTKIAFTTSDETNSRLILGIPDAAKLGAIKGRAILLDGTPELVQVPYISEDAAVELLNQFYRVELKDVEQPRQDDNSIPEEIPSFVTRPDGDADLSGSSTPPRNGKPNRKKTVK